MPLIDTAETATLESAAKMHARRRWVLVLLLYVGLDYLDPSIPGVFFFEADKLFMDSAVEVKAEHAVVAAPSGLAPEVLSSNEATPSGELALIEHDRRQRLRPNVKPKQIAARSSPPASIEDH